MFETSLGVQQVLKDELAIRGPLSVLKVESAQDVIGGITVVG